MVDGEVTHKTEVSFANRWSAALGLLATAMMWATMVPFVASLLPYFDPYFLSLLRYSLALPFLVALVMVLEGTNPFERAVDWRRLLILGAAMSAFSTFYTLGILYSDPLTAAVVLSVNPIVAAVLSRIMLGARLSHSVIAAIIMSIIGALLVVRGSPNGMSGGGLGFRGGEFLLILAVTCWSWYSLKVQAWFSTMSNLRVTTLTSATAVVWLTAVYVVFVALGVSHLPGTLPGLGAFSMLLCISWGAAGVAIVFWHHGTSRLGVTVATLYINLVPVFAFVLVAFMFNIVPNLYQIGGGLIVLAGVVQVQVFRLRGLRHKEKSQQS